MPKTRKGARAGPTARMKSSCCKTYKKKGRACKKCPVMAGLSRKKVKKLFKRQDEASKAA